MALSDDLHKLAERAQQAEARAAAARAKARAELEREVASARLSAGSREAKLAEGWSDLQRSWDAHVAKVRERLDSRRAEHDAKRAQRRAQDAEDYAAYAVAFAHSAVVEAEYAALDAVLARMDADNRGQRRRRLKRVLHPQAGRRTPISRPFRTALGAAGWPMPPTACGPRSSWATRSSTSPPPTPRCTRRGRSCSTAARTAWSASARSPSRARTGSRSTACGSRRRSSRASSSRSGSTTPTTWPSRGSRCPST